MSRLNKKTLPLGFLFIIVTLIIVAVASIFLMKDDIVKSFDDYSDSEDDLF